MLSDLRPCVERVSAHLGLELKEEDLSELLPTFSLSHMKANRDNFQPTSVSWKEGFEFIRKGERGDHASLYGDVERAAYAAEFRRRLPAGAPTWAPYAAE
mmetsp:Transcript_30091/g.80169  ORF Transcript_30091/g.80169 Transcript_30091/m.80169 type:complete len:100 (-) Transcript_30091:131-430(-)